MGKKQISFLMIIILLSFFNQKLSSQPALPSDFWGAVKINGEDAPIGMIITPTIDGVAYPSSYTLKVAGIYGLLSVNGDDPSTLNVKEGGVPGDIIVFIATLNGNIYPLSPSAAWQSGSTQQVDLEYEGEIPVELASFLAVFQKNEILLQWKTVSESNNFGFEIQKSDDQVNYFKIGFVPGFGTTSTPHIYKFTDKIFTSGTYYYRLKQIDTDGSINFSETIEINAQLPQKCHLSQNYPNPFNPSTSIQYSIPAPGWVKLAIFDLNGRLIRSLVSENQNSGVHSIIWDGNNNDGNQTANGIYIYRLIFKDQIISRKMLMIK